MVSVVFFTSIDFRKHAQALTSSPHAHAHAQAHASHLLLCSRTDQLCEAFIAPEPPTPTHHDRDLAGPELPRSTSITIAIAPIGIDREIGSIAIIEISEIAIAISPISREASIGASRDRDLACDRDLAIAIAISLAIEIGEIAIEIAPIAIAIAISPRTQFVLLGFLTEKLICSSGFYLSF